VVCFCGALVRHREIHIGTTCGGMSVGNCPKKVRQDPGRSKRIWSHLNGLSRCPEPWYQGSDCLSGQAGQQCRVRLKTSVEVLGRSVKVNLVNPFHSLGLDFLIFIFYLVFIFCNAGGGTQGLTHARQVIYTELYTTSLPHP
jgi:hypothetical protein